MHYDLTTVQISNAWCMKQLVVSAEHNYHINTKKLSKTLRWSEKYLSLAPGADPQGGVEVSFAN